MMRMAQKCGGASNTVYKRGLLVQEAHDQSTYNTTPLQSKQRSEKQTKSVRGQADFGNYYAKTPPPPLRLQWAPGHCNNPGNDAADQPAKDTVGLRGMHPFRRLFHAEKDSSETGYLSNGNRNGKLPTKGDTSAR